MHLPPFLQQAIEKLVESLKGEALLQAREELSQRYLTPHQKNPYMTSHAQRISYIATRMPATYAVISNVIKILQAQMPEFNPQTLLDLGSGPGTALWAVGPLFPSLSQATLVERDQELITIGEQLALGHEERKIDVEWKIANLENTPEFSPHDLVVFSYSLGELSKEKMEEIVQQAWRKTNHVLLLIEPGTPAGFERIRRLRELLIEKGGYMIAPCPHSNTCPLAENDWCHFSSRLERTSLHRLLKKGALGYEDEKYSYVAFAKEPVPLPSYRILRHPEHHSGHHRLTLCSREGIEKKIFSKKMGALYKETKKLEWGASFSEIS